MSGATEALEVLRNAGLKLSQARHPQPEKQVADHRKAARHLLHHASMLTNDVPKRPDVEIPLLFSADVGYSGMLIVSDSEEPRITLRRLKGVFGTSYYVSSLLKIDRAAGEAGQPFYLDFGQDIWIDSGVFYSALRAALRKMPMDYGSFEILWCPSDHRLPF
jgi:hypothetical protein